MVDLRLLRTQNKKREMVAIKRVLIPRDEYELCINNDINPDLVVREAFREVAEQLHKERLAPPRITEKIEREQRGDIPQITTTKTRKGLLLDRVLQLFENPDLSLTVKEAERLLGEEDNPSVGATMSKLKTTGILDKSTERPARYFNKKTGDPWLKSMLPPGTRTQRLG